MRNILFIIFLLIGNHLSAQINSFLVEPVLTDTHYATMQAEHLVVDNTSPATDQLFLFIGGTGSSPNNYLGISNFVGQLGYDVISISYENDVPAAAFSNSSNPLAFNDYRQQICYGTPLTVLQVDSLNSIYTRTVKLLNYLNTTYPNQNWDQYLLDNTTLQWDKIIVGGHSQGAGHACYFGKFEAPERVLMFSEPNDYSNFYNAPANWLNTSGITPIHKHYSYLHSEDNIVNYSDQLEILEALNLYPQYDTILVQTSNPPYDFSHCLYTNNTSGFISPHSKTVAVSSLNEMVWTYMLTSDTLMGIHVYTTPNDISIHPNPFTDKVIVNGDFTNYQIMVYDALGNLIQDYSNVSNTLTIDLTSLGAGVYFIALQHQTHLPLSIHKIIKE